MRRFACTELHLWGKCLKITFGLILNLQAPLREVVQKGKGWGHPQNSK
jgi:hypothetical protein